MDDPHCGDSMNSDGSLMALGSTGAHDVWVKLMNPHRGPAPLTESQTSSSTVRGERQYDLAMFSLEQYCQLILKYKLLIKTGTYPRAHSITYLLKLLSNIS